MDAGDRPTGTVARSSDTMLPKLCIHMPPRVVPRFERAGNLAPGSWPTEMIRIVPPLGHSATEATATGARPRFATRTSMTSGPLNLCRRGFSMPCGLPILSTDPETTLLPFSTPCSGSAFGLPADVN